MGIIKPYNLNAQGVKKQTLNKEETPKESSTPNSGLEYKIAVQNLADLNKAMLATNNKMVFKGTPTNPMNAATVIKTGNDNSIKGDNIEVGNSQTFDKIEAKTVTLKDFVEANTIKAQDELSMSGNSRAKTVDTNKLLLSGQSMIRSGEDIPIDAYAKEAKLSDLAHIDTIQVTDKLDLLGNSSVYRVYLPEQTSTKPATISVDHKASINKIFSEKNLEIEGTGIIAFITTKGNEITLNSPVIITDKIKFENGGVLTIKKDQFGNFAKIDPAQVENGKIVQPSKAKNPYESFSTLAKT